MQTSSQLKDVRLHIQKIKSLKRIDTQVQSVIIVGEENEVATNV